MKRRSIGKMTAAILTVALSGVMLLDGAGLKTIASTNDVKEDLYGEIITVQQEDNSSAPFFKNKQDMINYVRKELVARKQKIVFKYTSNTSSSQDRQNGYVDSIMRSAMLHTGNPKEGDYIERQFQNYAYNSKGSSSDSGATWTKTVTIDMNYYTTAAQEKIVDSKVKSLLSSLKLTGKNDYEKTKAIYDYMCKNIKYDNNFKKTQNKISLSAYSALVNKNCVCQGYSNLMYRLLLECGIDCRIVSGNAIKVVNGKKVTEAHSWNIVKLGGKYYALDATWDAVYCPKYKYFLCGSSDFVNHTPGNSFLTQSFTSNFPMAATKYTNVVGACNVTKVEAVASGVKVTWKKIDNACGYYVYRKMGNGSYTKIATVKGFSKVSWVDKKAQAGKSYTYMVKAYNAKGTGKSSAVKTFKYVAAGVVNKVCNGANGIIVNWNKATGATGYYVYKKTGTGAFTLVKKLSGANTLRYDDVDTVQGINYTYKIIPYSGNYKGVNSNVKSYVRVDRPCIEEVGSEEAGSIKYIIEASNVTGSTLQCCDKSSFVGAQNIDVNEMGKIEYITGLEAGKQYYLRTRNYIKIGASTYYSCFSLVEKVDVEAQEESQTE